MGSIFLDERAQFYAEDLLNRISIISDTGTHVDGMLKEPLQFAVEANWENIFSLNERFGDIQRLASVGNVGLFNAGIWTKKFYKGGSYLRIEPKIRVVDWNGDNSVINQATILTDLCLPNYKGGTIEQQIQRVVDLVPKDLQDVKAVLKKTGSKIKEEVNEGFGGIGKDFAKFAEKVLKDNYSNSPRPVTVKISNFFQNRFIVESVQVEFSKEMTKNGPLYADFDIVLSTPEVTTRGHSGLKQVSKPKFKRT